MGAVLKFQPREVKVADLDDGYTRIANEIYESIIGSPLTQNQSKVAHAIIRLTYGFNKKNDRIADIQIAKITNLPRQKVNKAKNELIAMNIITREANKIGINKVISEWNFIKCHQNNDNVTKTVTKSVTKVVTTLSPKQGHTKDIIPKTKDIKEKIYKKEISAKSVKTTFPENLTVNEANQKLASELGLNAEFEFGKFKDRNLAVGGKYINWDSAFSGWLRKAYEFKNNSKPQPEQPKKQTQMSPEQQREYDRYLFMQGLT